jgi:hypothetical protein
MTLYKYDESSCACSSSGVSISPFPVKMFESDGVENVENVMEKIANISFSPNKLLVRDQT